MYQNEGYWNVKPKIKAVSFPKRGKFEVTLQDGRSDTYFYFFIFIILIVLPSLNCFHW